jgi:hypothetical protein
VPIAGALRAGRVVTGEGEERPGGGGGARGALPSHRPRTLFRAGPIRSRSSTSSPCPSTGRGRWRIRAPSRLRTRSS